MCFELRVNSLNGEICRVEGQTIWTLHDATIAVEKAAGIPQREQRLIAGQVELRSGDVLLESFAKKGVVNLMLIRRQNVQAEPPWRTEWITRLAAEVFPNHAVVRFSEAPVEVRGDREVALVIVRRHGTALEFATEDLQADRTVVLAAVRSHGTALQYSFRGLRADRQIVLAAVALDDAALEYASKELQADPEVVLAALNSKGSTFCEASADVLWADKDFVLAAMKVNSKTALYRMCGDLWFDPEVSREADAAISREAETARSACRPAAGPSKIQSPLSKSVRSANRSSTKGKSAGSVPKATKARAKSTNGSPVRNSTALPALR